MLGACLSTTRATAVDDVVAPDGASSDDATAPPADVREAAPDVDRDAFDPDAAVPPSDGPPPKPGRCGPVDGGIRFIDPATLPQCGYDSTIDGGAGSCRAARETVSCALGGGCGFCLSDDG